MSPEKLSDPKNYNQWYSHLNQWILIYTTDGVVFGVLQGQNEWNGKLRISALENGTFHTVELPEGSIDQCWLIDKWVKLDVPNLTSAVSNQHSSQVNAAEKKKLKVYMVYGKDAPSILKHEEYIKVFRDDIFAGQSFEFDQSLGKAGFIDRLLKSDIAYLSIHSNPEILAIGNGEYVYLPELKSAYEAGGESGPRLMIVTGCETVQQPYTEDSIPGALGFRPDSKKKAYIGFNTGVVGSASDRYFRVFLAQWMKPKPDGSYRTLSETMEPTQAIIEKMYHLQTEATSRINQFTAFDLSVNKNISIIGDKNLKVTDL